MNTTKITYIAVFTSMTLLLATPTMAQDAEKPNYFADVQKGGIQPRHVPTGHLLFVREGELFGAPLELQAPLGRPGGDGLSLVGAGRQPNGQELFYHRATR